MAKIGMIGIRGMVGSTLLERMIMERDFDNHHEFTFFSTSKKNTHAVTISRKAYQFEDARDLSKLREMDIILTTQGSDYTKDVFYSLRQTGWQGYWIDAASQLRMSQDSIIILDPVNEQVIRKGISKGVKTFVGGNCTVSLLLMVISNLLKKNYVEWISTMTYQAISGAGAKQITELLKQIKTFEFDEKLNPLDLEEQYRKLAYKKNFPTNDIGYPLAFSLSPWIDAKMDDGRTKEEWKGEAELNKIMGLKNFVPVDGICVRVPTFRSHAQAVMMKLQKKISIKKIEEEMRNVNPWVEVIPNDMKDTRERLNPLYVSGKLTVVAGRVKKMSMGSDYVSFFTIGDQLLWGAAEPLRRMLKIILEIK